MQYRFESLNILATIFSSIGGKGKKIDFIRLLGDKLPDVLDENQKTNKVRYLLTAMNRNGLIAAYS